MLVIDVSDFFQNAEKIFDAALTDDVIINNKDGKSYRLFPVIDNDKKGKSPLENIPCVKLNVTTQEIVEIIRENRAGI